MLQEIKENEIIATCASEVFKLAEQPKPNDEFISNHWEMPQNLNIAYTQYEVKNYVIAWDSNFHLELLMI